LNFLIELSENRMKFAFLSSKQPTLEQHEAASAQGVELVPIGAADPGTVTPKQIAAVGGFDGVVVEHLEAARRLVGAYDIGVFLDPVGKLSAEGSVAFRLLKKI
jgi:hypothetical protein